MRQVRRIRDRPVIGPYSYAVVIVVALAAGCLAGLLTRSRRPVRPPVEAPVRTYLAAVAVIAGGVLVFIVAGVLGSVLAHGLELVR